MVAKDSDQLVLSQCVKGIEKSEMTPCSCGVTLLREMMKRGGGDSERSIGCEREKDSE